MGLSKTYTPNIWHEFEILGKKRNPQKPFTRWIKGAIPNIVIRVMGPVLRRGAWVEENSDPSAR